MTSFSTLLPRLFNLLDNVASNSCAKLQTKQKFKKQKKQKLISKAKIKISLGMPFFPNHSVSLNE